jgi:hypothetical protein
MGMVGLFEVAFETMLRAVVSSDFEILSFMILLYFFIYPITIPIRAVDMLISFV